MMEKAASILVLDHHKSAQANLADFPSPAGSWEAHLKEAFRCMHNSPLDRIGVRFDMTKSGCVLAWEFFNPKLPVPQFLLHMQDRDLWQFKLPGTREITATVFSHEYSFENWNSFVALCTTNSNKWEMIAEGKALLRQQDKTIWELLPQMRRHMVIDGRTVPAMNVPYQFASDAGHIMAEYAPFSATYWDGPVYRNFSLRSREYGADVSEIARRYGGGGHQHAAGFRVPIINLAAKGLL